MNGYQMLLEYFDCWFDGCCSSKFWQERLLHTGVCQTHNMQTSFDYCYILFSLNITITFRVHCYKEKRIALPLTEWASQIEYCQGKLPENMVKLCLWLVQARRKQMESRLKIWGLWEKNWQVGMNLNSVHFKFPNSD